MHKQCKGILLVIATFCSTLLMNAQKIEDLQFRKAEDLAFAGKIMPTKIPYHRVDPELGAGLPKYTQQLLSYGSGIAIAFKTSSTVIAAKWCVSQSRAATNLNPINNKGLDLYIKKEGRWQFAGVGRPTGECSKGILVKNMAEGEKECLLYLPTYDQTLSLEVGVEQTADISPMPDPFQKRILIYGSSIVQGAAASRPGMAYPARLSRNTGLNFLNLGLSGSAKMEKEAADLVASIDADAYVLDCVPNSSAAIIKERTRYLVTRIRERHPSAPIIVVQTIIREHGYFDQKVGAAVQAQNLAITGEVKALREKGVKDLYFITAEDMLGTDHEGTVDGTHPSDLGYDRMLRVLQPTLIEILAKHGLKPVNGHQETAGNK